VDQTTNLQAPCGWIENGLVIVPYGEELVVGSEHVSSASQCSLGADHVGDGVRRRLVQPGEDLFSRLSGERERQAGYPQQGQPRR